MKITALILNILGTFLLSVEAIKIENLKIMAKLFKRSSDSLNPQIQIVDKEDKHIEPLKASNLKNPSTIFNSVLFVPVFFILIFLILVFILLQIHFPNFGLLLKFVIAFFGGTILWTILIYSFEGLVKLLAFIENKVEKGIIGILGFIILCISFIIQYLT